MSVAANSTTYSASAIAMIPMEAIGSMLLGTFVTQPKRIASPVIATAAYRLRPDAYASPTPWKSVVNPSIATGLLRAGAAAQMSGGRTIISRADEAASPDRD